MSSNEVQDPPLPPESPGLPTDIEPLISEHEEVISVDGKKIRRRGVYLLPNMLTTGAMFAGFYAVIAGMGGDFRHACLAIIVAMILDGLDGRVARLTKTQSAFGAEYDSLSDMLAFGVAPALICFSWALSELGNLGWTAAFIYVACAALRLARFNVQQGSADKRFFTGLPSPSAAGLVVFMVWAMFEYEIEVTRTVAGIAAAVTVLGGLLMVLSVRYYSFKELGFKHRVPFFVILVLIFVFVIIAWDPPSVMFSMAVLYALSGPVFALYQRRKRRKKNREAEAKPVDTSHNPPVQ
ncbi:MAG: CDP-diacylglycerol--serine O-phosphatidyltransferase [Pseudomonadales bacterium]|jgi:CDP-diacylglycerol--serine O-phosphatidyltransferase|nr:CDP-diacylglycerol--serine O-phosphatidyltransferase [Pseudomonadales bacterium]